MKKILPTVETDHLIVGAGVAGITLARRMFDKKLNFLVAEKATSVGGRLATRRDQKTKFDHGAQFLKCKIDASAVSNQWPEMGRLRTWFHQAGADYKYSEGGMNSLAKISVESFSEKILLNHRIHCLTAKRDLDGYYLAKTDDGIAISAKHIYLTCPLPQSLNILTESSIQFPQELERIHYAKALVGLYVIRQSEMTPKDTATLMNFKFMEKVSDEIFSIANQTSKGLSEDLAFTLVMKPEWSEKNYDTEESLTLQMMTNLFLNSIEQLVSVRLPVDSVDRCQLKKWRYAHPLHHSDLLHKSVQPGLILLGDAFGGASIHGALRSAESIPLSLI